MQLFYRLYIIWKEGNMCWGC